MGTRRLALAVLLCLACSPLAASAAPPPVQAGFPPEAVRATPPASPASLVGALSSGKKLLLKSGVFDPLLEKAPEFAACESLPQIAGAKAAYIAQFTADLGAKERAALAKFGVEFLDYVPDSAYVVRATDSGLARLKARADLRWLDSLRGAYKVDPVLLAPGWTGPLYLDFRLFPDENPFALFQRIEALLPDASCILLAGKAAEGERLRISIPAEKLHPFVELASGDGAVWSVEPWFVPHLLNDNSIWVIQSYDTADRQNYALSATIWNHGITGTGQIVCVNDSGIDDDNCQFRYSADASAVADAQYPALPDPGVLDLTKKVVSYAVLPGSQPYDGFAFFDHGTHTSGTATTTPRPPRRPRAATTSATGWRPTPRSSFRIRETRAAASWRA